MNNAIATELVNNLNVSPDILIFMFTLPLIIMLLSFAKYIMGIKSFGIYVPVILTYMFYHLSIISTGEVVILDGLKYGLFITAIVFFGSYFSYKFTQKLALHYYSKLAIVTTNVTIILILAMLLLDFIGKDGILEVDVFSLILIASISERFTNIHASNQAKTAFMISLQTILLGVVCFLMISFKPFTDALLNYPWLILLTFPINYIIGRFSGLRITEIYRFKELLSKDTES